MAILKFKLILVVVATMLGMALVCGGCGNRPASTQAGEIPAADETVQTIENKGSDTIVNLALAWAEAYMKEHPSVRISVTGGGSGTGIAAMINGTVDLANASRAMKDNEIELAQGNGINPIEHIIAQDAIAVVVNPKNPVDELTIPQLSAIFTRQITNWAEVGGADGPDRTSFTRIQLRDLRLLP